MKAKSSIVGDTLLYFLSSTLSRATPFLLLPFLSREIGLGEYGIIGIYLSIISLFSIYIGLRPDIYIIKRLSEGADKGTLAGACLILLLFGALLLSPVVYFVSEWALSSKANGFAISVLGVCFLLGYSRIYDSILQYDGRVIRFSVLKLVQSVVAGAMTVLLVYFWQPSWKAFVFSEFLSVLIVAIYHFFNNPMPKLGRSELAEARDAARFLFSASFHVVGFTIVSFSDRFVIKEYGGDEQVGIYTVLYTYALILGLFHDSALRVWNPFFFNKMRDSSNFNFIINCQYGYSVFSILVLFVFLFLSNFVFVAFVGESYESYYYLVPVIAVAYTVEGVRKIFAGYFYLFSNTTLMAFITLICAVVNVALNFLFVPIHGLLGAAWATVFSFSLLTFFTVIYAFVMKRSKCA